MYPDCQHQITIDGWRYHYLDNQLSSAASERGKPSEPPPVILCVHGNPTWSFYWRRVFADLGDRFRVIAVDHIGCGLSDKPSRRQYDYCLANHRDNLLQLIDRLDLQRIVLLAHDWGGAIGLSAAVQRVSRMAGVMLLNTAAFPPPYIPWRIGVCRTPVLGTAAVRGLNLFARAAITMAMSRQPLSPEAAAGLLAPYNSWQNRVGIDSFVRDIPMSPSHPSGPVLQQLEQQLSQLASLPQLLVWGMQDWCFRPECLERFLQHWPDAQAVRLHDTGHYVMEDNPQETLAAIDRFLSRLNRLAVTGAAE